MAVVIRVIGGGLIFQTADSVLDIITQTASGMTVSGAASLLTARRETVSRVGGKSPASLPLSPQLPPLHAVFVELTSKYGNKR